MSTNDILLDHHFVPHIQPPATVVVGMSGGVDSSVSAALLKEMGYNVIGLFMKNWEEKDENGVCTSEQDYQDVVKVCDKLKIPHYSLNLAKEYKEFVFQEFIEGLKQGKTPNPDILCNREIKFQRLLSYALKLGAEALATGHYAQNMYSEGSHLLLKGNDPIKDQTYFVYTINNDILKHVLFPVGGMPKSQVRALAHHYGLATAAKKDSTGICFIGERNFRKFLQDFLPYQKGKFEQLNGKVVGEHMGCAYYTIGQRRGLGLGGEGDAWFVVGKDITHNIVYVERGEKHPALYADTLVAKNASWVKKQPPNTPCILRAKIRYRQPDQECVIEKIEDGTLFVRFLCPQRAITEEQSIVFYENETCLGGAIIEKRGPSYYEMNLPLPEHVST